jgi:Arc/MetJ-type ribon-helix-helix transcriptional regulator
MISPTSTSLRPASHVRIFHLPDHDEVSQIAIFDRTIVGVPCDSRQRAGMVNGMASMKITITLDAEQVDQVRRLVREGRASSVSGFIQHSVGVALDDIAGWGAMLAQALDESGGPVSGDERAWADEVLGVPKTRRRTAAA